LFIFLDTDDLDEDVRFTVGQYLKKNKDIIKQVLK